MFYVEGNNAKMVAEMGSIPGFRLDEVPSLVGFPLHAACRECSPELVEVVCSLPGYHPAQRNSKGETSIEVVLQRIAYEVDLI